MKHIIKTGVALFVVQYLVLAGVVFGIGVHEPAAEETPLIPTPVISATPRPVKMSVRAAPKPATQENPVPAGEAFVPPPEPTAVPVPQPPAADAGCIITVHGTRYNVTEFRTQHSGGDIFTCGADLTAVFDSQHSMRTLQRMAPLAVN